MSRIHLTIKYDDLTREFRREIWKSELSKARTAQGPASVGLDELQEMIKSPLNGREVSIWRHLIVIHQLTVNRLRTLLLLRALL